jgi:peptidoglycan/xylan/chitin deacetylase (PgdA/CDA1 family)
MGVGLRRARKVMARAVLATHSDAIALTFDDGPHPTHTPAVLDVLAAHNVTATFFVLGNAAQRHPELVQRMVAEGHAVGTHTMTQLDLHTVPTDVAMANIRAGRDAVEQITGRSTPLFRPPKGHLTVNVGFHLRRGDWRTWLWSVDSYDWRGGATAASVLDATQRSSAGDVIVMHDTVAVGVEGLRLVLRHADQAGWRFQTLS